MNDKNIDIEKLESKYNKLASLGKTPMYISIDNTLGGIIGIGVFYLFSKVFKNKTNNIINTLALISTILLMVFISILLFVN